MTVGDVLFVTASSELNGGNAWRPLAPPSAGWLPTNSSMPNWWQVQLRSAKIVTAYSIIGSDYDGARSIKDWTLQGSNDGTSFTTLDTRSTVTGWSLNQQRDYTFTNTTAYSYYRINITANNGSSYTSINGILLGGVLLYETLVSTTGATATAASQVDGGSSPSNALVYPPVNGWTSTPSSLPTWWEVQFPAPHLLLGYSITGSTYSGARSPNTFTFSGSNDGTSWTVLDTRSSVTGWWPSERRLFMLTGVTTAYSYYRVDITSLNGDAYASLGAVYFIEQVSTPPMPRRPTIVASRAAQHASRW